MQVNALENFRRNLRSAMEARGLSQRALAENLGMSFTHINRIICGQKDEDGKNLGPSPSIDTCDKLAGGVGFALSDLLATPKKFSEYLLQRVA